MKNVLISKKYCDIDYSIPTSTTNERLFTVFYLVFQVKNSTALVIAKKCVTDPLPIEPIAKIQNIYANKNILVF